MDICKLTASQLMQTEITSLNPEQTLLEVKHIYEKKKFHHHIPVTEGKLPVGIISLSDFLFAIRTNSLYDNESIYLEKKVKDIMSVHPVCLPPNSSLSELLDILSKGEIHAVLISENSELKGIVTSTDLLRLMDTHCKSMTQVNTNSDATH